MKIDRSSRKLRMSHELLDVREINTRTKKMSSKRMPESVAREGFRSRKAIRNTFEITTDRGLNTRRSKVRRMMRNDSPRIIQILEAMIPQPRNRSMAYLQILLEKILDRTFKKNPTLLVSFTSEIKSTRHNITNTQG